MKIIAAGTMYFAAGHTHLNGWYFDAEGRAGYEQHELYREALRSVLLYVAQCHGICFDVPQPEPAEVMTLDAERAALDAIAMARWKESP